MKRMVTVVLAVSLALTTMAGASAMDAGKDPDAARKPALPVLEDAGELRIQQARDNECFATVEGQRTLRVAGGNRYETAAQISVCMGWNYENTLLVYLASGENYPDALALGPSTLIESGPLLLTGRTALPAATRRELQALRPCAVVAVGGAGAISAEVLREADRYTEQCF